MSRDILVAIMAVIAVLAGFWCWWYENHGPKNAKTTDSDSNIVTEKITTNNTTSEKKN